MTPRVLIGEVGQIPKGEGRVFAAAGRTVAVFHTHSGEVFATQAECPHLQGPLADGLTGGTTIVCPLHDRAYDLRTGNGLNGEPSSIKVFPASLDETGKIWLTLQESAPAVAAERAMRSFILAAEIWVPTEDGKRLRLLDGLYGPFDEFRALSQGMQFGYDEGLPGKAWASRHPIILKEFRNSYFKRTKAAHAVGLTCGVALPVFAGEELKAVVVLFCGDDDEHVGAIELWHTDPDRSPFMRMVDGYYGSAEMFEFNSRHTSFPRGFGLPGRVWKSNMPLIVKDLFNSKSFLRWQQATEIGINCGLGIPYPDVSGEMRVMTFLSARDTPIARRFEIWVPDLKQDVLSFHSGDCDQNMPLASQYDSKSIRKGDGTIWQVWVSGVPAICTNLADDKSVAGRSASAAYLHSMLALPVMRNDSVTAVIAWYF